MIDNFRGQYWFLSNFYPVEVWLDDLPYPSLEHAFQAAKTDSLSERGAIRMAKTAGEAKKLGKLVKLVPDWNERRLAVMEKLLRQKFAAGGGLAEWLLETGDEELREGNTWGDVFYGVCNGVGENQLGKLLMKIRTELRSGG